MYYTISGITFDESLTPYLKNDNKDISDITDNITIIFDNSSILSSFEQIVYKIPTLLLFMNEVKNIKQIDIYISYPKIQKIVCNSIDTIHLIFNKIMKKTHHENTLETYVNLINHTLLNINNNSTFIFVGKLAETDETKKNELLKKYEEMYKIINKTNTKVIGVDMLKNIISQKIEEYSGQYYFTHESIYNKNENISDFLQNYYKKFLKNDDCVKLFFDNYEDNIIIGELIKNNKLLNTLLCILETYLLKYDTCDKFKLNKKSFDTLLKFVNKLSNYEPNLTRRLTISKWKLENIWEDIYKIHYENENKNKNTQFTDIIKKYSLEAMSHNSNNNKIIAKTKKTLFKKFNKCDKILENFDDISEIKKFIDKYEDITERSNKFDLSIEFFNSSITLSNWFDELSSGSSMGILIDLEVDDYMKLGISRSRVIVKEITQTVMSVKDYIHTVIDSMKKNKDSNLNSKKIVSGDIVGTSNSVIPLYINKEHWIIAKKQLPLVLGIILAHNPLGFMEAHTGFMFYLLADMTNKIWLYNSIISINNIKLYFALWRTCCQIAFEKGFHKGINSIISKYNSDEQFRKKKRLFDIDSLLGQLLSTDTGLKMSKDNINKTITNIFESLVDKLVNKSTYRWKDLLEYNGEKHKFQVDRFIKLHDYINSELIDGVNILISFIKMHNLIKEYINNKKSYKKTLDYMEENYGLFEDKDCDFIINLINKTGKNLDITIQDELFNNINKDVKYYLILILEKILYNTPNILDANKRSFDKYKVEFNNCENTKELLDIIGIKVVELHQTMADY
jgi:hypothetical protein